MAIAVDDQIEQGSTAPPASMPTNKPVGRPKVEIVEDTGNDEEWTEVGKIIVPGQLVNENQPNVESSTGNDEISQPIASRPRSPRHSRPSSDKPVAVKAAVPVDADNTASPAIAPKGMLSQRSPGEQQNVQTTEPKESTASPAQTSSVGEPPVPSNNAQSGVADKATSSGSNKNEPTKSSASNKPLTDDTASPAFVTKEELEKKASTKDAKRRSEYGQGEQSKEEKIQAGATKEEADRPENNNADQLPIAAEKSEPAKDSGPLQGVAGAGEENFDSFSDAKKPLEGAAPISTPGSEIGERPNEVAGTSAGAPNDKDKKSTKNGDSSADADGEDDTVVGRARALRSFKVNKNRTDQQKKKRKGLGGKLMDEAEERAKKEAIKMLEAGIKKGWQAVQEVSEDGAFTVVGFIIFGPITIILYIFRWMFGNMMSEVFVADVPIPSMPGAPINLSDKAKIHLVPAYALADPQDYVRHSKFLIIAFIAAVLVGFIIMLLYYYTHWWEALIAAVRGGWGLIINLLPAYKP